MAIIKQLSSILDEMSNKHRLAFSASCCERLIPNYEAFLLQEKLTDNGDLRKALDIIWQVVIGNSVSKSELHRLIKDCALLRRDSDDYKSIFTSMATNAVVAVMESLEYCLDKKSTRIQTVVDLIMDSYDGYLQIVNEKGVGNYRHDPLINDWIDQSPLIRGEIEQQQKDLEYLMSHAELTIEHINMLQSKSREIGIHPLKRGLL